MGRPKIYSRKSYQVPEGVETIVRAICADYHRRQIRMLPDGATGEVLARFTEWNGVIDRALGDMESGVRMVMLDDVANRRGYDRSMAGGIMAKNTYYNRRNKFIYDVACGLALVEVAG